ncbi:unnamed protein product [Clonostachys byssicola]|uniref:Uncharacterized protein n=1 Tax=Clonostachys byssicola TaxID=160290 RepID=A0A9N9Y111_9HYPO|nr:unnamed protein product [Clonostachys byssicola]
MPFFYSASTSWNVSSNINRNSHMSSHSYSEQTRTTPEGTTVRTAYQQNNDPVEFTEERFGPGQSRLHRSVDQSTATRRVEDVTDQEACRCGQRAVKETHVEKKKDELDAKKE